VRKIVRTSAQVTDIETSRRVVGSNLTAVELSGLTRVELAVALVLAAAASGLTLALGLHERRRTFAIASALGANARQLGAFVRSESAFVTACGLLLGAAIAAAITHMLIKVLTGVFDPPPDALAIPWSYLLSGGALTSPPWSPRRRSPCTDCAAPAARSCAIRSSPGRYGTRPPPHRGRCGIRPPRQTHARVPRRKSRAAPSRARVEGVLEHP
jgi:hypothetical protein